MSTLTLSSARRLGRFLLQRRHSVRRAQTVEALEQLHGAPVAVTAPPISVDEDGILREREAGAFGYAKYAQRESRRLRSLHDRWCAGDADIAIAGT